MNGREANITKYKFLVQRIIMKLRTRENKVTDSLSAEQIKHEYAYTNVNLISQG